METNGRQFGLYDTFTKKLVWHIPTCKAYTYTWMTAYRESSNNLKAVWIDFKISSDDKMHVWLSSVLTREILHRDYDLSLNLFPYRYRLTPHGAQYLSLWGKHWNAGDIIYPSMVELILPSNNPVTYDDYQISVGFRLIAMATRS